MKVDSTLFKLYHIDGDIERMREEVKNVQDQRDENSAANVASTKEYDEKRLEKANKTKTALTLDRKIIKLKAEIENHAPRTNQIKEEKLRAQKKIEASSVQLTKLKRDAATQAEEIAKMEKHLLNIDDAEKIFDAEQQKRSAQDKKFELTPEQQAEYNAKKIQSGTATYKLKTERDALAAQLTADEETASRLSSKCTELESRLSFLQEQEDRGADRL